MIFFILSWVTSLSVATFANATEKFEARFTDQNGVTWSQTLAQDYTNGCPGANSGDYTKCSAKIETAQDSDAQKACLDMHARLPTREEVMVLVTNFDHLQFEKSPVMTEKGCQNLSKIFGGRPYYCGYWWTSTVVTSDDNESIVNYWADNFDPSNGINGLDRTIPSPVICVRK